MVPAITFQTAGRTVRPPTVADPAVSAPVSVADAAVKDLNKTRRALDGSLIGTNWTSKGVVGRAPLHPVTLKSLVAEGLVFVSKEMTYSDRLGCSRTVHEITDMGLRVARDLGLVKEGS